MFDAAKKKRPKSKNPLTSAFRLLARRDYSVAELEKKLLDRGFEPQSVALAINELIEDRWLNDFRYGESLCRHLVSKGYGPRWIKQVWRDKGIHAERTVKHLSSIEQLEASFRVADRDNGDQGSQSFVDSDQDATCQKSLEHKNLVLENIKKTLASQNQEARVTLSEILEEFDEVYWEESACKVINDFNRKRWQGVEFDLGKFSRRAFQLLQRRGFEAECAHKAIRRSIKSMNRACSDEL